MRFRLYLGPTRTTLLEPIKSLNADGSIDLYDGRKLSHCRQKNIEFEHDWSERDPNRGVLLAGDCGKFIIDVLPPSVRVRPVHCGLKREYRFIDGNWYWMVSLADKLDMLWLRYSPLAWPRRRYGIKLGGAANLQLR